MSAISQINLNHLTLMALIMRYTDSLLSQTTEGVIPELSTSVFFLEFPLFYSGLALKKGDKQLKTSFLIPPPFIKIVWKKNTVFVRDQQFCSQITAFKTGDRQWGWEYQMSTAIQPLNQDPVLSYRKNTSRIAASCRCWPFIVYCGPARLWEQIYSTSTPLPKVSCLLPLLQGLAARSSAPGPAPASAS